MTNPTPKQMLELAKICEPDKGWKLDKNGNIINKFHRCYNPLKEGSFTANHELLKMIFALLDKGCNFNAWDNEDGSGGAYLDTGIERYSKAKTKQQAILNLAVEALL